MLMTPCHGSVTRNEKKEGTVPCSTRVNEVIPVSTQSQDEILFRQDGALAFVTFNRPQARNALTWNMYDRLLEYCERIDGTDEIRAVILTGAGDQAFVAGGGISQFQTLPTPPDPPPGRQRSHAGAGPLARGPQPA